MQADGWCCKHQKPFTRIAPTTLAYYLGKMLVDPRASHHMQSVYLLKRFTQAIQASDMTLTRGTIDLSLPQSHPGLKASARASPAH